MKDCIVANYTEGPLGPHPIGQFVTCCNHTALSRATSWFMQNHKNLTVLLHPLTRYEIIDHTERAMWLGQSMPLDISALNWEVSLWSCN